MTKVFIDGSHGTTGLKIKKRLENIKEYQLLEIDIELRKDLNARIDLANSADITLLCLPDEASKEIVPHIKSELIDTATVHRINEDFAYGFAEIGFRDKIKNTKNVANPGCHVTGFLSTISPLVKKGVVDKNDILTCHSITGYSGGGNKMIADYESSDKPNHFNNPRQYGLNLNHKHLAEMKKFGGLEIYPIFSPILANFYSGMAVSVPLYIKNSKFSAKNIVEILKEFYNGEKLITVADLNEHKAIDGGFLNPEYKSNKDDLDIVVCGNDEQVMLISLFDNLGKGASGSAIQCLNIKAGNNETLGLNL